MARMRSGFAVIGDTQRLPGYSVLLCEDPAIDHLTDLDWQRRTAFLFDLALAVEAVCRDDGLRRINYEVLGNSMAVLHGHVHSRYGWEPANGGVPVWRYEPTERYAERNQYRDETHGALRGYYAGA
jgi:diadenosine tetraphosphate (Ap4A) HIT family hydrolase